MRDEPRQSENETRIDGGSVHVTKRPHKRNLLMPTLKNLESAGKLYGDCAKQVTTKCSDPENPTAPESELRIAFGIASDWSRRAAAMRPIDYDSNLMNKSPKKHSVSEMIRFGLSWSAMNALFSRNSVVTLLNPKPPTSELDRFRVFYNMSGVDPAMMSGMLTNLHNILATPTLSAIPGKPPGTSLPILQVLHEKYTPPQYQKMSAGKLITAAVGSGNYSKLDLPVLIYLMRNWSVHGGLLGSSFRSVPSFNLYINTISRALSEVHACVASVLRTKV